MSKGITEWKKGILGLLIPLLILITSCGGEKSISIFVPDKFDEDEIAEKLSDYYQNKAENDSLGNNIASLYQANGWYPLWFEDYHLIGGGDFLKELKNIEYDGLNPESYSLSKLEELLNKVEESKTLTADEVVAFDTAFTHAYLKAAGDLLLGVTDVKEVYKEWYHRNDTTNNAADILKQVLVENKKYPSLDSFRSSLPAYALLRGSYEHYTKLTTDTAFLRAKAAITDNAPDSLLAYVITKEVPDASTVNRDTLIKSFQEYYGWKVSGKLDDRTLQYLQRPPQEVMDILAVNMERMRWLPRNFEESYVLVNIPAEELWLYDDGVDQMHMRVIVGRSTRQTPPLREMMTHVVFNPPWGVPPGIIKNDVGPGVARSGAAYLRKKGLKAYTKSGQEVSASAVNGSNYMNYNYRQPPGPRNALGYIKFHMPNKYNIYLHDTPDDYLFTRRDRAQSSGCVRVQYPHEVADYILNTLNKKNIDRADMDSIIAKRKTIYVKLDNQVPAHLVYLTAYKKDGTNKTIQFHPDIYKRDSALISVLRKPQAIIAER